MLFAINLNHNDSVYLRRLSFYLILTIRCLHFQSVTICNGFIQLVTVCHRFVLHLFCSQSTKLLVNTVLHPLADSLFATQSGEQVFVLLVSQFDIYRHNSFLQLITFCNRLIYLSSCDQVFLSNSCRSL